MISYCENCEQTKKDLNETKQKLVEFQNLAKKIVQTDLILRKYSDKERECEKLSHDLRKKEDDFDDLNDRYEDLIKENDTLKKKNKEYSKEKAKFEQDIKQKDELIASLGQKESDNEQKLNLYSQNERLLETKSANYQKQIEDLRNELKLLNNKYEQAIQKLNLESVKDTPNLTFSNLRTSTQILNVNFKENLENVVVQAELPKRETTFYLGSESENDETEPKAVLEKKSLIQDESKSISLSNLEKTEALSQLETSERANSSITEEISNRNVSLKQQDNTISSSESSGSDSESESSGSSSSTTSTVSEKSKCVFSTQDLFGSELSEDENEVQEEKSIDITNIQEEYVNAIRKNEEESEKNVENKIDLLVNQYMDNTLEQTLDQLIESSYREQLILGLICDKICDEEINSKNSQTSTFFKSVCTSCIEEERIERKNMEKKIRDEIKKKLEEEICEEIFDEKFSQLILECSQRVLAEEKNERIELIYESILDQVCKETYKNCLMEFIFDDMTCVPKPLIKKLEFNFEKEEENRSNKRRFPVDFSFMEEKGKRSRRESGGSESSWKSSLFFGEDNERKTLEEFVKECLADYFRKFNFKIEFTFEELDRLIDRLARAVKKKSTGTDNSKFVAHILIKHYLNNKFIPLDDLKLNQVDESELKLYKQISIYNTPVNKEFESITRTIYGKRSNHSSHTNYLQTKLNDAMMAKITNEEEKYVYILRKLIEYPTLELVQYEFLNCLKVLILSNEFQITFKMKMGRMLCFVCKSRNNYDYLKSFICDLITSREISMPMHFQNMILWFARIWPECLTWPCSIDQVNDEDIESAELQNPILFIVMNIVKNSIYKNNIELEKTKQDIKYSKFSNYYVYILESFCNWSIICTKSLDTLSFLKASIQKAFESSNYFILDDKIFSLNGLMLEYCEAFKLMCLNEDWSWTKQNFIENFIFSEMDDLDKKLKDSAIQLDILSSCKNKYAFLFISLNSIISLMCPDSNYGQQILSNVESKIISLETIFVNYEFALVESGILLSRFDPLKCLKIIEKWLESFKDRSIKQNISVQIPKNLKLEIQTVQSLYKDKIDNNVQMISF